MLKSRVVDGWFSYVTDLAENIMFLGRLKGVWDNLIGKSQIKSNERVLDIGCGTGYVAINCAKKVSPDGESYGIDASEKMIEISNKKIENTNLKIRFIKASMAKLPFNNNYFDIVLSCQAFHHAPTEMKIKALEEIKRVLKPEGRLLLCDHGKPYSIFLKILFSPFRWNIGEYQADNFRGKIPQFINNIFCNVKEVDRFFGWMRIWKAIKR